MSSVSLIVVTYNEAHRILDCLADARPHVDEIVVVDQSSTDGTRELAERYADAVISDKHHGYCEASRALAARNCTSDWILVLDADENMSTELKLRLRELIDTPIADGYRLMREFHLDGQLEWVGDKHYRLFRRDSVEFLDEIHTEPQPTGTVADLYWVGIIHTKCLEEQLADELRYDRIVRASDIPPELLERKLALNWRLNKLREEGKLRVTGDVTDEQLIAALDGQRDRLRYAQQPAMGAE